MRERRKLRELEKKEGFISKSVRIGKDEKEDNQSDN